MEKRHTVLVGSSNKHTLIGNFTVVEDADEFSEILVKTPSILKHEQDGGKWSGEHKSLLVEEGKWTLGRQVEFNPSRREITQIWD